MQTPVPPVPQRPLRVTLPKPRNRFADWLLGLALVAMTAGMFWITGPGLLRDGAMLGQAEPATAARFVSGRCKSKLVLHICDLTIDRRTPQGVVREESHIGFFELHVGARTVQLMQKRGDPTSVTSDIALDHYWNRVVTAGVLAALFGGGGLVLMWQAFRPRRDPNAVHRALSGRLLQAVPVDILGQTMADKSTRLWHYAPRQTGPASAPAFAMALPGGAWPFVLDGEGRTALAVTDTTGTPVMLIDEALSVLDLTASERAALQGWRQARLSPAPFAPLAVAPT